MNNLLKNLLLGGSATALTVGAAFTASAQTPLPGIAGAADDIETVNSSAGRLNLEGFAQPTPVTVIGLEQLNRDAKVQIGDEIRELPQIRGGNSITTGSNVGCVVQVDAGLDSVALRNLGAQRNLVLFDHQRVSPSTIQEGVVDLSLIPSGLVQRIDVVTGGASAAWGSDAVTGVINIVINKTFEGFKGSAGFSNSTEVSNPIYRASLAWGTSFLGGKGHIVAAADFIREDADVFSGDLNRAHQPQGRSFVYNSAYCAGSIVYAGTNTTGGTCSSVAAGQPALVYAFNTAGTQTVEGGLIQSNTNGTVGSAFGTTGTNVSGYGTGGGNYLKGVFFTGDNAAPNQFNYGTLFGTTTCYGTCTNTPYGTGGWGPQSSPYHSGTYFTYVSYQILPDLKASVQLNYARRTTRLSGNTVSGTNRVIYADNPFIPDSIAQAFVCNTGGLAAAGGQSTATCGTTLSNGYNPYTHTNYTDALNTTSLTLAGLQARPTQNFTANFEFSGNRENTSPSASAGVGVYDAANKFTWNRKCAALYNNCGFGNTAVMRGVFTLDGSIGDDWTWTAYIQNSDVRIKQNMSQVISARVNNALDAVRITSGNVGTSGLPIGSIQCRGMLNASTATAIATNSFGITTAGELAGCVPFNPFGNGEISAGTIAYVSPAKYAITPYGQPTPYSTALTRMQQAAGEFSLSGVLPWKLPAGDVGVSIGGDWRLERQGQYNIDARSQMNGYPSGNMGSNWEGHLHAEEGFLEVDAPILKNQIVNDLLLTVAGRITNYSFSGLVETWKIGGTSQINDDVKLRVTWSYDIRQPDIWDLYAPGANSGNTCNAFIPTNVGTGPGQQPANNNCFNVNGGNRFAQPEKADTIAAGIVLTPTFLDGVTASIDWYQIHLHGALFTPGQTEPITRCQNGDLNYCSLLVFASAGSFLGANGCGRLADGSNNPNRDGCVGADTLSQIVYVHTAPVNAALLRTAGFDFAVAYAFDLFTGTADVGFNGNYTYDFSRVLPTLVGNSTSGFVPGCTTACNVNVDFQGAGAGGGYYSGGRKFGGVLDFNYREGAWSFGSRVRINGDSEMDFYQSGLIESQQSIANLLIPLQSITFTKINGQDVAITSSGNRFPGEASTNYNAWAVDVDLRSSYRWSSNITLTANVDNVMDNPSFGGFQRRSYRFVISWRY